MGIFAGKKGLILGVANSRSIATGIAEFLTRQGAEIGYSYLPDDKNKNEARVRKALDAYHPSWLYPCNVDKDEDVEKLFMHAKAQFSQVDFVVHAIAYAPLEEIRCATLDVSRGGFLRAMDTSVYSFIKVAHHAAPIMSAGGSLLTLSYYGGEKVVPGYNLMGLAKAALECSVRYLANDLGPKNIRVNAISAGPVKTLAASAIGDFGSMLDMAAQSAPLRRTVSLEELGGAAGFLLGPWSGGMTGEIMHVDCGYNILSVPPKASTSSS
ncbi:MAG: enoyl-ACP reductase [Oligoflexales bacterium]|nr:enoyl-ACP reductase [Oligoflexales bacterium]